MRALASLLVAVAALATPPPAAAAVELSDLEDEVMCPICGTLLELAQSPQAERQRAFIRRLIDEGRSKREIRDALVEEYGPEVLATPGTEGFDLAAWVVPGLALILAAGGVAGGVRRWRRASRPVAESPPPDPEAEARLERDMARYDL